MSTGARIETLPHRRPSRDPNYETCSVLEPGEPRALPFPSRPKSRADAWLSGCFLFVMGWLGGAGRG